MKKIEAVIAEDDLYKVFDSLVKLGVGGFTYFTARGRGIGERPMVPSGRGGRFKSAYSLSAYVFIIVSDNDVEKVVGVIASRPVPDAIGEGKIFISDVADAIDVGTKKHGEASL
ncbi:MAG: hypothetical protein AUI92_05720 [Thaumarchaeota archaeon 13_1_40CM_3_38_6]|nr:MAG: hypothetical protein AUI92_05720 [Thaumarchaeota archaeon 13_1_40CM_3_38_6]